MASAEITHAINLLRTAVGDPSQLCSAIERLQCVVWQSETWEVGLSEEEAEVLWDLAHDLDYYEADAIARAEDPSFFGDEKAVREIVDALARVEIESSAG